MRGGEANRQRGAIQDGRSRGERGAGKAAHLRRIVSSWSIERERFLEVLDAPSPRKTMGDDTERPIYSGAKKPKNKALESTTPKSPWANKSNLSPGGEIEGEGKGPVRERLWLSEWWHGSSPPAEQH